MKLICLNKIFPVLEDEYLEEIIKRLEEGEVIYSGGFNIVNELKRLTYKNSRQYNLYISDRVYVIKGGTIFTRSGRYVLDESLVKLLKGP